MRKQGIGSNPVLIGVATVVVTVIAVVISYNANTGLPFVPAYDVNVELPNAAKVQPGNFVLIGGTRVGQVLTVDPAFKNGRAIARLKLRLDQANGPLPVGTRVKVRQRSVVGLKVVVLETPPEGTTDDTIPENDTIPLEDSSPSVETEDLLGVFDVETRQAARGNLREFGNATAGRGLDINATIGAFAPLFEQLIPVARNLNSEQTNLPRAITGLARFADELRPLADTDAQLVADLDTTFGAVAEILPEFDAMLVALSVNLREYPEPLHNIRPFLTHTAELASALKPGLRHLPATARNLESALKLGGPALRQSRVLSAELENTFASVDRLAGDPAVQISLNKLEDTVSALYEPFTYATPAQTVCNYASLFFRNVSASLSPGNEFGGWFNFSVILQQEQMSPSRVPTPNLHANPYGNTAGPGQPRECEAGNEPFVAGQKIGNVPGTQPATTLGTERPPLSQVKR